LYYLKRKHQNLFYYKTTNNKEVDFYIQKQKEKLLIQVSVLLKNIDTKEREVKALIKAMDEQKLDTGYIYTYNETEKIEINSKTIHIIPFWKICLE